MKISVKKYIRSDKNGEYKSHCAEICLESGISIKLLPYSPQSNEKTNVERNDECIIYKFEFTQNLCGGTILTVKGNNKKFCLFRKESIWFDQNTIFSIWEMERKEIQLEIFQSVGYLVKVQVLIPKRIKIGPMTVDCKIRLE